MVKKLEEEINILIFMKNYGILKFKDELRIIDPKSYRVNYEYNKDYSPCNFCLYVDNILVFESKNYFYSIYEFIEKYFEVNTWDHILFSSDSSPTDKLNHIRDCVISNLDFLFYEHYYTYGMPKGNLIYFIDIKNEKLVMSGYYKDSTNGELLKIERIRLLSSKE